jgi:PIN domain nuclease of toxin-antitoxin system
MILLDTHTLLFWMREPEELGNEAYHAIDKAHRIGVHVISCFEITILVEKNKIELDYRVDQWIADTLSHSKVELIPLSLEVAIQCAMLPDDFHRDPVDRMLAAACLLSDWALVTRDPEITEWGYIETIWD